MHIMTVKRVLLINDYELDRLIYVIIISRDIPYYKTYESKLMCMYRKWKYDLHLIRKQASM